MSCGRPAAVFMAMRSSIDATRTMSPSRSMELALRFSVAPRGLNDLDRAAIVAFMAYDYPRFFANASFEPRSMVSEGGVVVTEHRMSATLPNGRPYVNDYCFAYEVVDGQVTAIREYMDTRGGWSQVFGDAPPEVLLESTPPDS